MARVFRLIPWLLAAFLAASVALPGAARADETITPSLHVRGQGTVSARPDLAILTLGPNVRREDANAALDQSTTLITRLNQLLREQGIAERDVTTRQFNLTPEFSRPQADAPAQIVAWRALQIQSIKVRDFSKIGPIIDQAARILGNDAQISGISFTIENTEALASQARAQAIANARQRAEEISAAAGVRLIRILSINESSAPPPSPVAALAAPAPAGAATSRAVEVSTGEQNLTVTVDITWEIG